MKKKISTNIINYYHGRKGGWILHLMSLLFYLFMNIKLQNKLSFVFNSYYNTTIISSFSFTNTESENFKLMYFSRKEMRKYFTFHKFKLFIFQKKNTPKYLNISYSIIISRFLAT